MEFKKTVMFLGVKRRVGDKGISYVVNLFCPGGDSWEFYVKESRETADLISQLLRLNCGTMVDASFIAGKFGKETYIRLTGVEDAA